MLGRSLLVVGVLGACANPRGAADVPVAVLSAVGDTVLALAGSPQHAGRRLYAADSSAAKALAAAARRAGTTVALAPGQVWCVDRERTGRPVGTVISLRLDSLASERALVRWSATCLMTPRGETTPSAFGALRVYELVRRDGRWQVARSILQMEF